LKFLFLEENYLEDKMSEQGTLTGKFEGVDITFVYTGGVLNGQMHGKGKSTWSDGTVLEGDWVHNRLHGKGKMTSQEGVYEGDFVDGLSSGKGKMTYADGQVYEGDYADGMRTGRGKMTNAAGAVYEGGFVDGKFHGKGKITNPDGSVYEGDFADGKIVLDTEEPTKFVDIFEAISPLGTVEDLRYFIEGKGVNVNNVKNEKGLTPLLLAAFHGNIKQVEFLVSNGANIHATTPNGFNALHWLAFGFGLFDDTKRIETAKFLISKGVDVIAKNNEGKTPSDLAKETRFNEFISFISLVASRRRHGFTSFWLIFSLISFALTGLFFIGMMDAIMMDMMPSYMMPKGLMILSGMGLAGIVPVVLLLKWKKIGFWIYCGVGAIAFVLNIVSSRFNPINLFGLIGIPIMWGVLHIRKDGKSAWEQLE
jgi:hypothetical protein